jgi:hypothetical protein
LYGSIPTKVSMSTSRARVCHISSLRRARTLGRRRSTVAPRWPCIRISPPAR